MDAAVALIETGEIGLLIVDSVASMIPKSELEGTVEDNSIGLQARKMGQSLRKLTGLVSRNNTTILFVNQLRDKINSNPFLNKFESTVTPGGRALKFYSSIRLEMKKLKDNRHRMTVKKQKTCPLMKGVTEFEIGPNGIDQATHNKESLLNVGVLTSNAGKFYRDKKLVAATEEQLHGYIKERYRSLAADYKRTCDPELLRSYNSENF